MSKKFFQDTQKYSECQLVVALNAAYYFGENFIDPYSDEYERLVDLVCARNGYAINIEYAYKYLRLEYIDVKPEWRSIIYAMNVRNPISFSVFTEKNGFHSVLIVDLKYNDKEGEYYLKIPNLSHYTDKQIWISWPRLERLKRVAENIGPEYGYFRLFHRRFGNGV